MGRDMADRKSGTDAEALADELVDLGYEGPAG
jgi:hypothetical protein